METSAIYHRHASLNNVHLLQNTSRWFDYLRAAGPVVQVSFERVIFMRIKYPLYCSIWIASDIRDQEVTLYETHFQQTTRVLFGP